MVKNILRWELVLLALLIAANLYLQLTPLSEFVEKVKYTPELGTKFIPYCTTGELSSVTTDVESQFSCLADHPGEKARAMVFILSILILAAFPFIYVFVALACRLVGRVVFAKYT
ncbi:hypothetical protein [Spartinivicinus ruber]|uniref:hypothetical protein n=1 Tax=Spartinivicinus ruber TaxID=2683272 RepID=UPI0013D29E7F|nr:hypothetical protein [Spartinivicinus ruber]